MEVRGEREREKEKEPKSFRGETQRREGCRVWKLLCTRCFLYRQLPAAETVPETTASRVGLVCWGGGAKSGVRQMGWELKCQAVAKRSP